MLFYCFEKLRVKPPRTCSWVYKGELRSLGVSLFQRRLFVHYILRNWLVGKATKTRFHYSLTNRILYMKLIPYGHSPYVFYLEVLKFLHFFPRMSVCQMGISVILIIAVVRNVSCRSSNISWLGTYLGLNALPKDKYHVTQIALY